ncbi:YbfB/YjiJ family MFS transporter, partial [Paracoccus aestuarii]
MTRTPPASSLIGAAFALTALAYGLSRFAFGLLMPQIKAELGLTPIQAGWIGSAGFGAYCIGVVVALLVVPLWGPRRVAVLSGLFATGGLG